MIKTSYIINVLLLLGIIGYIFYIFIIKEPNDAPTSNNELNKLTIDSLTEYKSTIDSLTNIIYRYKRIESDVEFIQEFLIDSIQTLKQSINNLESKNEYKEQKIDELIQKSTKNPIIIRDYAMIDTTRAFMIYKDKNNQKWLIYINKD